MPLSLGVGACVVIGGGGVAIWKFTGRKIRLLLDGLKFGEAPRWHAGRLYFSDFYAREVVAVNMKGERETVVQVPDVDPLPSRPKDEFMSSGPSGLGWTPDGSLLIVEMMGRRLLKLAPGSKEPIEVASMKQYTDQQCNDMCVDEGGNAYIGNFGFSLNDFEKLSDAEKGAAFMEQEGRSFTLESTHLIKVTQEGKAAPCTQKEIRFPNGCVITPDGKTLIVAETFNGSLAAYPRLEDGSLGQKLTWASIPCVFPDGICLDSTGSVWVAAPAIIPGNAIFGKVRTLASWVLTGKCSAFIRVQQGGTVQEVIPCARGFCAIACMLGGDDGRTLFMMESRTSSSHELQEMEKKGTLSSNSRIRTTTVDVPAARSDTCDRYCAGYC